jgi:subtilisin family serine protease
MKKRFISLFTVVMFIVSSLMLSGFAFVSDFESKSDGGEYGEDKSISFVEERIFNEATLDHEFADDIVLVIMNRQETMRFREYSTNDFAGMGVSEVKELTRSSSIALREQLEGRGSSSLGQRDRDEQRAMEINADEFRTILSLYLQEPSKQRVLDVIRVLEHRDDILYAGPNFMHEFAGVPNPRPTHYSHQWALHGTHGIQAEQAWNITIGSANVRVGVIDTGIDGTHPDLVDRLVSALHMDFTGAIPIHTPIPSDDDNAFFGGGHGTHVAGIIGANRNSGIPGIIGVCQDVSLISLRISENGLWYVDKAIQAVDYATTVGIDILNYSGRVRSRQGVVNVNDPAFEQAIRNFPGLFTASAGNINQNNDTNNQFPANYSLTLSNLISVGSIDFDGQRSFFSNFGVNSVSIFAPGGNILSTLPNGTTSPAYIRLADGYAFSNGTSIATPHVAGVAALLLSTNPNFTGEQMRNIILDNSNPITITTPVGNQKVRHLNAFTTVTGNYIISTNTTWTKDISLSKMYIVDGATLTLRNVTVNNPTNNSNFGFHIINSGQLVIDNSVVNLGAGRLVADGLNSIVVITSTPRNPQNEVFVDNGQIRVINGARLLNQRAGLRTTGANATVEVRTNSLLTIDDQGSFHMTRGNVNLSTGEIHILNGSQWTTSENVNIVGNRSLDRIVIDRSRFCTYQPITIRRGV